jgi:hypothetical protein
MKLEDYTIDHTGYDWRTLLGEWRWLLRGPHTVWLVTKAGDLLVTTMQGSVHMLDVGQGELRQIASSKEDAMGHICSSCAAGNWLMKPVVDKLTQQGVTLGPGEVYSYKLLPAQGGTFAAENRVVMTVKEHLDKWGKVHAELAKEPSR